MGMYIILFEYSLMKWTINVNYCNAHNMNQTIGLFPLLEVVIKSFCFTYNIIYYVQRTTCTRGAHKPDMYIGLHKGNIMRPTLLM